MAAREPCEKRNTEVSAAVVGGAARKCVSSDTIIEHAFDFVKVVFVTAPQ
jgi:hypothetical protein